MVSITLSSLIERIQKIHPRTRKAQLNIILGLILKGGGMLISLLLVPLTIDYLSKETYGTWLTISSIVTMLAFLDIGIGNGLRNKFSEAVSRQNTVLARSYVSTAYLIFGIVQVVLVILFIILYKFIPWQNIFNTTINIKILQSVVLITVLSMAVKLTLDILSYILLALQEPSRSGQINLLANILLLIGVYFLTKFSKGDLLSLASITAVAPIVSLLLYGFFLYKSHLKAYRPALSLVNLKHAKGLLSLGYKFFIIQIAVIVLFYTDNLIITQLFGPSEVTTYNVAFRYFNAANTLFTIVITPYWSAFTEAYTKGDHEWMKRTNLHMRKMWVGLVLVIFCMVIMSDYIYTIWVGDRVNVSLQLSICMGFFIIVTCWNGILSSVINGLGKIQLQLYVALLSAVINIPLSIFLGRTMKMGSAGVILATSIALLFSSVFGFLQVNKLLSGKARGIWNR